VALARALGGEVINADSMQLYRGMDVGTAKLSLEERQGVPHHVLDIWDVRRSADVATYQRIARGALDELRSLGRTPVVVGGSGLYVRALLDDLDFPGTDPDVRSALEAELASVGPAPLYERLRASDPEAAAAIEPNNARRIVRALEVVTLRGSFTARLPQPRALAANTVTIGLEISRDALDQRIAERVDRMWSAGFVDEVRTLAEQEGLREGRTASRALGYAQILRVLDGELTEAQAIDDTVRSTRRFARRQESWFRKDGRTHWLAYDSPDLLAQALTLI
jgi:tRNA dimethylallyltransferase